MKLDNYAFSGWQTCPLWYETRIVKGYAPRFKSAALNAGGVFHEGLATWYKTHDPEAVIARVEEIWPLEHPIDDYRDLYKVKKTLLEYMKEYSHESFTIVPGMVEVAASLPTGMYLPCENRDCKLYLSNIDIDPIETICSCYTPRELIEYGGIFDTLVDFAGQIYILEHKTTSQLGPRFFDQFKPNNQITGYVWLASQLSGRCDGALINAIGWYKASPTRFQRHITTRTLLELERWKHNLWVEACAIQQHRASDVWPMRPKACTIYGACEFLPVHQIDDLDTQQRLLDQDYIIDQWEYEKRDSWIVWRGGSLV